MHGLPVASGLASKRLSERASGTTSAAPSATTSEQKETSREVSATSSPWIDVNHCRSASTSVTAATGVSHTCAANVVSAS